MEKINGTEKTERARNWTTIFYPSELKEDWREILEKMCVPACVSPLHTPENKKPHYHILISGDKKTVEQIKNEVLLPLTEYVEIEGKKQLKGIATPQKVVNLRSTVRYFLHLDNPNKQQFEDKKLDDFGGFDSSKYLLDSDAKKKEKFATIKDVIKIIKEKKFSNIIDLLDFLGGENDELFTVCCENAYLCTQLVNCNKYVSKTKKVLDIVNEAIV